MAISKTGGIQLDAEINNELDGGRSLGAYRGTNYLHVPSNTILFAPANKEISFSQLDGVSLLGENTPLTPNPVLLTQSNTNVQTNVSSTDTQLLSVMWRADHNLVGQPVLVYNPVQNNPPPTTKWYEKIGSNWTLITGMNYSNVTSPQDGTNWFNIEVNSSIEVPLSTATTRIFKAVGYTYTSDGTTTKATNTQNLGSNFSVATTVSSEPTITAQTQNGGTQTSSGAIITYTDGSPTINPILGVAFNYTFAESTSAGWTKTNRSESHVSYVSYNSGAFVASSASGVGPYGPFIQSHDPTRSPSEFGYWVGTFEFTTPGEYRFKLVSSVSVTFTKPDGTTGYVITATDESIHTVTITEEEIDNILEPILLSATISEDEVNEEGMFTLTIVTQNAIGHRVTISADEEHVVPPVFATKLIEGNTHQIVFGGAPPLSTIRKSNKYDDRTLTVSVTPVDDGVNNWKDSTAVTDTILIKNTESTELFAGPRVGPLSVINEGDSFTFTLKGTNFRTTDYTWDTTFPSEAVTATSGSFSTPYAGSLYTGNYEGSFTVPTTDRSTHYEDVTGGKISVYENGVLLTETAETLQIKNTHAKPVTLPTATANPIHTVYANVGRYGTAWSGTLHATVTLGTDGTYTTSQTIYSEEQVRNYATPQPLEGDWLPRVTGVGDIAEFIEREPHYYNDYGGDLGLIHGIYPAGAINASASFSGASATLSLEGIKLVSSIADANVTFTWEFYNTASGATRPGGTIDCYVSVFALPNSYIYPAIDPYAVAKVNCTTAGGTWNSAKNSCDLPDPWASAKTICNIQGGVWNSVTNKCDMSVVDPEVTTTTTTTTTALATTTNETGTDIEGNFPPLGQLITSYCDETTKMGVYANGYGGTYQSVIEFNSTSCGYEEIPASTGQTATTGTTNANIELYVDADLQALIQAQLDFVGALDLSNILADLDLRIDI